jgi:Flp pilus assembly protein TadG
MRGAVAVEFALVTALFLLVLLVGIIELGRVFYYMNATAEATRLGARIAVVCDMSGAQQDVIRNRMRGYLDVLPADHIAIDYNPPNCTAQSCAEVSVRVLPGATFDGFIPFAPITWTLPPFTTTLPRESLDSAAGTNPVCQ